MALEEYTVDTLSKRIRREFNLPDDAEVNAVILNKLNDAQQYIVNRRIASPWLIVADHALNLPAPVSGTGTFTNGALTATALTATAVTRDVIVVGATASAVGMAYTIESVAGNTATFKEQYRNTTTAALAYTQYRAYVELPENFLNIVEGHDLATVDGNKLRFIEVADMARLKNSDRVVPNVDSYFTIVPDPLNLTKRWYLLIYPYLDKLTTLRISYYREPDALVTLTDEPAIPRINRGILLAVAFQYIANWKGDERLNGYRFDAELLVNEHLSQQNLSSQVMMPTTAEGVLDVSRISDGQAAGEADFKVIT